MSIFDSLIIGMMPIIPKPVVGFFSRRYIAGATEADAIAECRRLNAAGCRVTLDVLGEDIRQRADAEVARDAYVRLLTRIQEAGVDGNVSLKPTMFGLTFGADYAYEMIRPVIARAHELGNFVRIDMEDATSTDTTLTVFGRLRQEFDNLGVVLQACLRRTIDDAARLAEMGANVRLCKGIYIEPYRVSWRDPEVIRRSFRYALEILLRGGCYVGIATHDELLISAALHEVHRRGLSPEQYEFQMLLGVTERLREVVVASGQRMRVYVPYGQDWYGYSTRRLRENPSMAGTIAKDILGLSSDRRRR